MREDQLPLASVCASANVCSTPMNTCTCVMNQSTATHSPGFMLINVPNGLVVSSVLHAGAVIVRAVVAILRTNNRDIAFARGVELVRLGCRALEVTMDSPDFTNLVKDLIAAVGSACLIGAGTITNAAEVSMFCGFGPALDA
jgi:hypothetical protein